jgi:methyl-accepting chemotaxis protein
MQLLITVAANLERHAKALEQLADELEQSAPPPDTAAAAAWAEEDVDDRIDRLRQEAKMARRAIKRVEDTIAEHGEDSGSGSERAAA